MEAPRRLEERRDTRNGDDEEETSDVKDGGAGAAASRSADAGRTDDDADLVARGGISMTAEGAATHETERSWKVGDRERAGMSPHPPARWPARVTCCGLVSLTETRFLLRCLEFAGDAGNRDDAGRGRRGTHGACPQQDGRWPY